MGSAWRWRLRVDECALQFQGLLTRRSIEKGDLAFRWVRRYGIGPRVLRLTRRDGAGRAIDVPKAVADERLLQWLAEPPGAATPASEAPVTDEPLSEDRVAPVLSQDTTPLVTNVIVAVNVLAFIVGVLVYGRLSPTTADAIAMGANAGIVTLHGQWWRLWSSTFLHGGLFHLAANMYALWQGGRLVEALYGRLRFSVIYVTAGGLGSLLSVLLHAQHVSLGASGAIFGVYGALLVFPRSHRASSVLMDFRSIQRSAILFCALNVANGFAHAGIDNAAHIGGLLSGLLLGLLLRPSAAGEGISGLTWAQPLLVGASGVAASVGLLASLSHALPPLAAKVQVASMRPGWTPPADTGRDPARSGGPDAAPAAATRPPAPDPDVKAAREEVAAALRAASPLRNAEARFIARHNQVPGAADLGTSTEFAPVISDRSSISIGLGGSIDIQLHGGYLDGRKFSLIPTHVPGTPQWICSHEQLRAEYFTAC